MTQSGQSLPLVEEYAKPKTPQPPLIQVISESEASGQENRYGEVVQRRLSPRPQDNEPSQPTDGVQVDPQDLYSPVDSQSMG